MLNVFEQIFNNQKNKINEILNFAYNNKYSTFYKQKYNNFPEINSYKDFQNLPFLEKKEIISLGLENFTFVSSNKIIRYMFSSGTTDKPLITAHDAPSPAIPRRNSLLKKKNVKKILILTPIQIHSDKIPPIENNDVIGVPGDIYNLPLMAHLVSEAKIDGISTTPTILEFFVKELKKISNFDFNQISWLELSGEFCTNQRIKNFEKIFSNAYFDHTWGATETGGYKGYRCEHLCSKSANIFHGFSTCHFLEVVNERGKIADENEEGEIVHTDLYPKATTIIRYKTGDLGKINKIDCSCGNLYTIELLGRANYDRLKLQGVILHVQAVENSLKYIKKEIKPGFKIHVYEKNIGDRVVPELKIQLILKDRKKISEPYFKEVIAKKISDNLYLSSKNNLSFLINKGIFKPLIVEFIEQYPRENKKKNIISHLIRD